MSGQRRAPGVFVAVSGVPSAGKTTFIQELAAFVDRHQFQHKLVVVSPLRARTTLLHRVSELPPPREPTWVEREHGLSEYLLLHMLQVAVRTIRPAIEAGMSVIADRWVIDHEVSQRYFGVSITPWNPVLAQLPKPDANIWIKVPAAVALQRARERADTKLGIDDDFVSFAVAEYPLRFSRNPYPTVIEVDGRASYADAVERVAQFILDLQAQRSVE